MRPSLRLVIGALCASVVLVVAVITLAITYTVSLATVRDIGKKHSLALATTARLQTEAFFDRPTADVEAHARIFKRAELDLPSSLPDQTDDRPKDLILQSIWLAQDANNYGYAAFGSIFDDGSGCSGFSTPGDLFHAVCRFVHEWPAGNMSIREHTYYRGNATNGPPLLGIQDTDSRFAAYGTIKLVIGGNPNGMWYPVSMYQSLDELYFTLPAVKPIFNRTGGYIGVASVGQPLGGISVFLRGVKGTPNTEAFAVQSDGYLIGSSHATPAFEIRESTRTAQVPAGCASSGDTAFYADRQIYHGCRSAASAFPYAPLQKAAGDPGFLHAAASTVVSTEVDGAGRFFLVSTPVANRFRFWGLNIVLCMPEADILGNIVKGRNTAIGVTAGVFVVAALLSFGLVYLLLQPLSDVSRQMLDTARLKDSHAERPLSSLAEIRDLQLAYAQMNTAIQSFTRYVPRDVVKDLMKSGQLCEIKMLPLMCTMLFVDIAGFTSICERVPPNALSELVSLYFDRASRIIMEHDGLIDKYIGDCIMAVWGAPFPVCNQEVKATLAGKLLDRETTVNPLDSAWDEAGEVLRVRTGISTGEVLAGNMGSAERMNYTVIGDPVNLAARLESMNKQFGTRVMVSEMTAANLGNIFVLRFLLPIAVVGKEQPVKVYEVLGLAMEQNPEELQAMDDDEAGLAHDAARRVDVMSQWSASSAGSVASTTNPDVQRTRRVRRQTSQMVRDALATTASSARPVSASVADAAYAAKHTVAVLRYTQGCFGEALALLDANNATATTCGRSDDFQPARSVELVRDLCERYLREGPPTDFDGTFKALDK